jgi:hypothetical protein
MIFSRNVCSAVDARCSRIAFIAQEMQEKMNVTLTTGLMRVPKKLKYMKMNDFFAEFGLLPNFGANCCQVEANEGAFAELKKATNFRQGTSSSTLNESLISTK